MPGGSSPRGRLLKNAHWHQAEEEQGISGRASFGARRRLSSTLFAFVTDGNKKVGFSPEREAFIHAPMTRALGICQSTW
jgi:hypothetical protein